MTLLDVFMSVLDLNIAPMQTISLEAASGFASS